LNPAFELWQWRRVVLQLVHQHLILRYRRTFLGFVWTVLNPLLNMIVGAFVFAMIMRFDLKEFAVFVYAGMIPWLFFSQSVTQAGAAIINNEAMLKKIYLPRELFPFSATVSLLVENVLSMASLFIIALILGAKLTPALLFVPVSFFILFVFCLGLALLLNVAFVYFRDLPHITGVILQAGFYLTPVLYPLTFVPERYRPWFEMNPMLYFLDLFRSPIYEGRLPSLQTIEVASLIAVISLATGAFVFWSKRDELIYRL
jgi:ABC-type polysaccharide/polyol phosphate export permease